MKRFKNGVLLILTLALMSVPFIVFFKAQSLADWWQLHSYTPPAAVAALASQDTMTSYAMHVFYVNHPALETNASQFRQDCNESEKTIVLGCYHGSQNGIYVYDVSDPRLAGVQQVTAAHEMLHAGYDRLSSKDKTYVDGLLQDYFANQLKDQRIIDTINAYRQTEPNDVVNEMHSVFGTEVANLPQPLENYYKKYFANRQAVVAYANNYEAEFTTREDQIKADDARLAQLKSSIDQQEQDLQAQLTQINSDRSRLNSERNRDPQQYNADVASFNSEVDAYNAGVDRLRNDIAAYNQLVNERNAIAQELASLDKSIDTRLAPQATQ